MKLSPSIYIFWLVRLFFNYCTCFKVTRKISLNEEKNLSYRDHPLHFPPSHPVHAYRSNRALFFFLLLPPVSFSYPFSFFPFLPPHPHRLTPVQRQRLLWTFSIFLSACVYTQRSHSFARKVYREFIGPNKSVKSWSIFTPIFFFFSFSRSGYNTYSMNSFHGRCNRLSSIFPLLPVDKRLFSPPFSRAFAILSF